MLQYIVQSIKRKIARRITKKYPTRIDQFSLVPFGTIHFANWLNPLVKPKAITIESINFFRQFIKEGDFVIDIGSNIGHMTVPMALASGKQGITLAFDPNPVVFEILSINATLNPDYTSIYPYNVAISNVEEEYYFISSEASFNNGGISKEKVSRHGKYCQDKKIKGIVLESFLQEQHYTHPIKLIKIDTEGFDTEIIKSIKNLILLHKPVIITECFGKSDNSLKMEQFEILESLGYSLYYFSDFSSQSQVIPILKKEDMLKWFHFDLYAMPKNS